MVFDRVSYWSRLFINECFVGFFFLFDVSGVGASLRAAQLFPSPIRPKAGHPCWDSGNSLEITFLQCDPKNFLGTSWVHLLQQQKIRTW